MTAKKNKPTSAKDEPKPSEEGVISTAAAAEAPAVVAEAETPKAGKNEVVVRFRDHRGQPTSRTFSKEVHGASYAKLAEEFQTTNAKACEGLN